MDNLTHTLTGLLLSRAGLRKLHPHAGPLLMIAANAPDVDVISGFGGAASYFQNHRGLTHALASIPVVAVLPIIIVALMWPRQPKFWLRGWLLSLMGVGSHVLLDWTNQYRVRLFLPWHSDWSGLMSTNVLDPWIWAILLVASLMPLLGRLVSSEIGGKAGTGTGVAVFGLLLLTGYDVTRWFLHERAASVLESQIYEGEAPQRVSVYADSLNPMLWHGIVETGSRFVIRQVHLARESDPGEVRVFFKPEVSPPIQAAAADPLFEELRAFSRAILWTTTPSPGGDGNVGVSATDLFFQFSAHAIVDPNNRVLKTEFHF
jgi:inner membrane protein